jgi:hypothetical protein
MSKELLLDKETFPYPEGALDAFDFEKMKKGTLYYGVWRRQGKIDKFYTGSDKFFNKDREINTWCEDTSERRAFRNYFHALAYSFKIKAARRAEGKL